MIEIHYGHKVIRGALNFQVLDAEVSSPGKLALKISMKFERHKKWLSMRRVIENVNNFAIWTQDVYVYALYNGIFYDLGTIGCQR